MWRMQDKIRLPEDLGRAIKLARRQGKLRSQDIATHAGKSRNVLNRLERGEDVTVGSLMAILRAMGLCIRLEKAGMPTMEEMKARFGNLEDDDE